MSTPLKMLSSKATRDILAELVQHYEKSTQQAVSYEPAGGVDVAQRVEAGEKVDVVVLASEAIDKLLAKGRLVGTRVDLAKSGVGVAVREGSPRPDISTEEALKQAVLASPSLGYSTGPSGDHIKELLKRFGVPQSIRIVVPPAGTPVAQKVADGTAALGFQQLSELLNQPGIDLVGPLPPAVQLITIFSGAIAATSTQPEAARALLEYLASQATSSVKERYGMESA